MLFIGRNNYLLPNVNILPNNPKKKQPQPSIQFAVIEQQFRGMKMTYYKFIS